MTTTIAFETRAQRKIEATCTKGVWTSDDPRVVVVLNNPLAPPQALCWHPDPDFWRAQKAIVYLQSLGMFNPRVVSRNRADMSPSVEGRVY